MAEIRVTLRWLQVLDKLEPWFKDKGEFVFWTKVTSGDRTEEYRFPEQGHYPISDHPPLEQARQDEQAHVRR